MRLLNNISFPNLYNVRKFIISKKLSKKKIKYLKIITMFIYIFLIIGVSYATGSGDSNLKTVTDLIDKVQQGAEWLVVGIIIIQGLFQVYEANNDISGILTAIMEVWVKYSLFQGILAAARQFFGSGLMGMI